MGVKGLNQAFLGAAALHSLRCTSLEAAHTWCTSTQTGVGELELLKVGLKMGSGWWAAWIQAHICQCWSCSVGLAPSRHESSPLCLTPGEAIGFLPTARCSLYGCLQGGEQVLCWFWGMLMLGQFLKCLWKSGVCESRSWQLAPRRSGRLIVFMFFFL